MNKSERVAYDKHIDAIMVQNDVLDTAKMEGRAEGRAEGIAEGRAEGRAEGIAEGRAEGMLEEKKATAIKMKEMGIPVGTICQITGLPEDEVNKL